MGQKKQTIKEASLFVQVVSALGAADHRRLEVLQRPNSAGVSLNIVRYLYDTLKDLESLKVHRTTCDWFCEVAYPGLDKLQWIATEERLCIRLNGRRILYSSKVHGRCTTIWSGPNVPIITTVEAVSLLGHL